MLMTFLNLCFSFASLFYASTATGYDQMYWAMLLNLLVYMPTLSLANTVSYNALEQYKCDLIKDFPPIRVWGTIGFICAMWAVDLTGFKNSSAQLYVGAISALLLGVYSFTLPACKPAKTENKSLLSAWKESTSTIRLPDLRSRTNRTGIPMQTY